ncbi:meiotic recombination protein spo11 [Aspergillus fumigatus Z5]|nr:meiotic recombination protein spo11 [Aspergillus fumigatus Z5]
MENAPDNAGSSPARFFTNQEQSQKERVQTFIDNILIEILDELRTPDGRPTLTLKRRSRGVPRSINPESLALESEEKEILSSYSWPGTNAYEAWKFTAIIRGLSVIAEAIQAGLVVSKRDIYYSDPACFGSQQIVDTIIDDIAHTIGVDRAALNVEAVAKGLVAGYYRLMTKTGEMVDARLSTKDVLIPKTEDIEAIDASEVKWVLILEKESTVDSREAAITLEQPQEKGKGYPDLSTRAFVRRLLDETRHLPAEESPRFYALVDSDPDGMAIMSTYKYGSMAHAHDNEKLNVSKLCWLGLRTSDVIGGADSFGDEAFIRLSLRDRKKAVAMLSNNPVWAEDGPEQEWRAELQQMLMLNLKAEIEILYNRQEGLEGWINKKMTLPS